MNNASKTATLFFFIILGMILPVLVYWTEHGGLGSSAIESFQPMGRHQQAAQVAAGLYIKPAYMLIAILLIMILGGQTVRPMRALFWGLIAFLAGETFCAINFIAYRHESILSEYLHSYGMALAFGFLVYSLIEVFDLRFRWENHSAASRRAGMFAALMISILALLPLTVPLSPTTYQTELFGFDYAYARFDFYQWYEARTLPLLAFACLIAAWLVMLTAKNTSIPQAAKMLFSAGAGALGFSIFRVVLGALYANQLVWFEFWEETTELMMVVTVGFVLWQYQPSLFDLKNLWQR